MYQKEAEELTKNTEVMEGAFKKAGLKLLQFSFQPYSEDDADANFIAEIEGDNEFDGGYSLKVNLYDKDGKIFLTEDTYISSDFSGYDTFNMFLSNDSKTLVRAKKARVYLAN